MYVRKWMGLAERAATRPKGGGVFCRGRGLAAVRKGRREARTRVECILDVLEGFLILLWMEVFGQGEFDLRELGIEDLMCRRLFDVCSFLLLSWIFIPFRLATPWSFSFCRVGGGAQPIPHVSEMSYSHRAKQVPTRLLEIHNVVRILSCHHESECSSWVSHASRRLYILLQNEALEARKSYVIIASY